MRNEENLKRTASQTYTMEGCPAQRSTIHYPPEEKKVTRNPLVNTICKLTPEQATMQFIYGESIESTGKVRPCHSGSDECLQAI